MRPDPRFVGLPKPFWAMVRLLGQGCGYAKKRVVAVPTRPQAEPYSKICTSIQKCSTASFWTGRRCGTYLPHI